MSGKQGAFGRDGTDFGMAGEAVPSDAEVAGVLFKRLYCSVAAAAFGRNKAIPAAFDDGTQKVSALGGGGIAHGGGPAYTG